MKKQVKHTKKYIIGSIVFYVVTAFLVFYIAVNAFAPDKVVNYTGFQLSVIPSGSMEPEINVGDIIILTKVDEDSIEEGDIVAFYNNINMNGVWRYERIVHRVVEVDDSGPVTTYITKGDANDGDDIIRPNGCTSVSCAVDLTSDMILAEVKQIGANNWALRIPLIGYVVLFLQWLVRLLLSNPILLLLVVLNIGIIVALVIVIRKTSKDKHQKGLEEDKKRIKASDITGDDLHDIHDDEEDGSA